MRIIEHKSEGFIWAKSTVPFNTPQQVEQHFNSYTDEERLVFDRICDDLPTGRQYMEIHWQEYGWTEEMLARASEFSAKQLQEPVPYFDPPWWCFENSYHHAEQKGLLYVEGIGISPNGPMVHAWNSTDGTDVIDYTWPWQHKNKYFGIVYDLTWMKKYWPIPGGILGYLHEYTQEGKKLNCRLI